jgi:hypothetical protein
LNKYKTNQPNVAARQQPTITYGLVYLRHGGTIINEKYDEEIAHYHNWEKFIKHCCEKIPMEYSHIPLSKLESVSTLGKNCISTGRPTFSNMCMNGNQLGKPYYKLTTPIFPSCTNVTKTHNHIF